MNLIHKCSEIALLKSLPYFSGASDLEKGWCCFELILTSMDIEMG